MTEIAKSYYYRFRIRHPAPEKFEVFDKPDRHPEWFEEFNAVVERFAAVWRRVGLEFPLEEVMEAW
jgi:hypothetical protein